MRKMLIALVELFTVIIATAVWGLGVGLFVLGLILLVGFALGDALRALRKKGD